MILGSKKRESSSLLLKVLPWLGFYGSIGSMVIGDVSIINTEGDRVEGVTSHLIIALCIAIFTAFIADKDYRKILLGKWGLSYWMVMLFYSVIGLIQGNNYIFFRADIGTLGWLIGGLALFRLMIKLPNSILHLFLFILIGTLVIQYSQLVVLENPNYDLKYLGRVIGEGNILFYYSALLIVPTGIGLGILVRRNIVWMLSILSLVGLHFYNGAFLSGTRSVALYLIIILIVSSINLSYEVSQGVITLKKSKYAKFISLITMFMALTALLVLTGSLFSGENVLAERAIGGDGDQSSLLRLLELSAALSQLNEFQLVIGGGIGYSFDSILGYQTNLLHIGIFTFLLKGGILLFSIVVVFLYIRLPMLFLAAWLKPLSFDPKVRTAILVVLPGIFAWIFLLTISGGYNQYNFLGVGFGFGTFLHICDYGLNKFLSSSKQKS
jgi:hypothetical protein